VAVLDTATEPLTVDEITDEALRRGLLISKGKTPAASMAARLYLDVCDNRDTQLVRIYKAGTRRARRGSVRWL
jgi:hypothetical protein